MKQPDPRDEAIPEFIDCDQCGDICETDELCPIPLDHDNSLYKWVCVNCYDEVCDEEGYEHVSAGYPDEITLLDNSL